MPIDYELYGMVVHMGSSLHSGHYISLVKAPNGQWNEISDSMVRERPALYYCIALCLFGVCRSF